jgi:transposase
LDKFAGIITTDGTSVSIMYNLQRKIINTVKSNKSVKELVNYNFLQNMSCDIKDYNVIRTADPGFKNMVVVTDTNLKKENDIVVCASKNYYHDCKINQSNNQKKIIYKRNPQILEIFQNMPTNKTNNINSYLQFISYNLVNLYTLLDFHYRKPFRKLQLTTYIFKQKTMNNICKKITTKNHINDSSKKVLLGFGNWSTQKDSIIKGHKRGPVVELKKKLRQWADVVLVDEYLTSKTCCKCHCITKKVSYNNVSVNSVLRCQNNECGTVIDRDINASKNIFTIFKCMLDGLPRPNAFNRNQSLNISHS